MKRVIIFFTLVLLMVVGLVGGGKLLFQQKMKKPLPLGTVTVSAAKGKPGSYIKLMFEHMKAYDLMIEVPFGEQPPVYDNGEEVYAYVPIPVGTKAGTYNLSIYKEEVLIKDIEFEVETITFGEQNLTISEDQIKVAKNETAMNLYQVALELANGYHVKQRLYEEELIVPVQGRISTEFGVKRYYNNSEEWTRHWGIDLANKLGTPIVAPASGVVTYTGFLPSHGNYVMINHGDGFGTAYAHLDEIRVSLLSQVAQGDIIGMMGTTGFSTGPHLHWEITLNNVHLSPWIFFTHDDFAKGEI